MACRSALVIGTPADASLPRAASTGEPGISLGRAKFRVIAAHSVMTNSTTLRSTYLTASSFHPSPDSRASGLGQVRHHRQQRVVVVRRQGVRVAGRRPPGEVLGGEQAPAAAVVQRNEG